MPSDPAPERPPLHAGVEPAHALATAGAAPDSSSPSDSLQTLAHQQTALARALVSASPPPGGFDAARLTLAAQTLLAKRTASAAKAWPELAHAVGRDFPARFAFYAQTAPAPSSPRDDAHQFAAHLTRRWNVPPRVTRLYALSQAARTGLYFARAHPDRQLLIAVRIPFLGPRALALPLPARSRRH